jgi:adenylate cyclase
VSKGFAVNNVENENEALWQQFLVEGQTFVGVGRAIFRTLPHDPRCMSCHSPFEGYGGRLTSLIGRGQSREDPRFCNACLNFSRDHPGGAYVDLAMVFADVRGSTPLAERVGDREFSHLIDRFFQVSAASLINSGALIDRLAGDEAIGFFVPGLAGPNFAARAVESAKDLLMATGHTDPEGPWIPVGAGVHYGKSFLGMVGSTKGVSDFTALGNDINVGARIASAAGPGELLASLELCHEANVDINGLEQHQLSLKGKREPMQVAVIPLK